jgi:hypothetical protein
MRGPHATKLGEFHVLARDVLSDTSITIEWADRYEGKNSKLSIAGFGGL